MVTDDYGNKLKGFYIIGFFEKGMKSTVHLDIKKPFRTDENGISSGHCFTCHPTNRFATNWFFIQEHKIKDLDDDKFVRDVCNEVWEGWCKEHGRKYKPIFEDLSLNSGSDKNE